MSKAVILFEDVSSEGTDWGVSFQGSNPPLEMAVICASKEDAVKLKRLIDERDKED